MTHPSSEDKATARGPLSGLRVVEIGQVIAAPFATAVLADLGADVIKIERPEVGDDARCMGPAFRHGDSLNFHIFNRGKKSVVLDLKSPAGRDAALRIIETADVLVHNMRPGVAEDLGLGSQSLCERYPRLVYCAISAFGSAGPLRGSPGYEPLVQAFSGMFSVNGGPDDPPMRVGPSICDQGAGMWAVIGIMAKLHARALTGRGGIVETSLLETALVWLSPKLDSYANEGLAPKRHASGHPDFVPYQRFDAADGPLLICAGNDRLFAKLAAALDRATWIHDERFLTNRARLAHKDLLIGQIDELIRQQPRSVWMQRFSTAGVPHSPIHTIDEVLEHPQIAALNLRQPVPETDYRLVGLPVMFDGVRPTLRGEAPRLGEHGDSQMSQGVERRP